MKKLDVIKMLLLSFSFGIYSNVTALASEEYSLSDLMRDQSGKTADTKTMELGTSFISDVFGYVVTVGVYGLIASQFIMTMLDLLYISVPFTRKLLVGGGGSNATVNGVGHFSGWDELRDKRLAEAEQYAAQGNVSMAQQKLYWAERAQDSGMVSDARRAEYNQRLADRKEKSISKPKIDWRNRCFISNELKSMISKGTVVLSEGSVGAGRGSRPKLNIISYFKKRILSIIMLVMAVMLLIVSNVFVGTGMNVGKGILKLLGLA